MKTILTEQEIINTYDTYQQEQSRLYREYKRIKQENPAFGYKRIARLLGQPYPKTRWWHTLNRVPVPIQTVAWLQQKELLNFTTEHDKLHLIGKVLGALFGDGGIFGNLNAIFLSSAELESVKEFGENLKKLFGNEIEENSRIIEGGEWGHSWCYQNTNRAVIRFFMALGAPIGDKSFIPLNVPVWIQQSDETIQDEFYGSFFGGELGVPKIHIDGRYLDTLSLGITGTEKFAENRITFLETIAKYLIKKTIKTGKISINDHKKCNRKGEPTKIYRLLISTEFENVTNFMTLTKMNYCSYKPHKLAETMNQFSEIKRQRFQEMISQGNTEVEAANLLKITLVCLEIMNNYEDYHDIYHEAPQTNTSLQDDKLIEVMQPISTDPA